MQEYKKAWEEAKVKMEEARKLVKGVFEAEAISLIKDLGIENFSWTQYTPYFNDGDVCVFGANIDYPDINNVTEWGYTRTEDYDEVKVDNPPTKDTFEVVKNFLRQFEEDDYLYMFGDHVEVTVTADGITIEDYDHD